MGGWGALCAKRPLVYVFKLMMHNEISTYWSDFTNRHWWTLYYVNICNISINVIQSIVSSDGEGDIHLEFREYISQVGLQVLSYNKDSIWMCILLFANSYVKLCHG